MPVLELVRSRAQNADQAIDVVPVGSDGQPVALRTMHMIRLAVALQRAGLQVWDARLEDSAGVDSESLSELKDRFLQAIRTGDGAEANQTLLEWLDPLLVTELAIRHPQLKFIMHFSRNGRVGFGGNRQGSVQDLLRSILRSSPDVIKD